MEIEGNVFNKFYLRGRLGFENDFGVRFVDLFYHFLIRI